MDLHELSGRQLNDLAAGVRILEPVLDLDGGIPAWLYLLTSSPEAITRAKEAIEAQSQMDYGEEAAPEITEVAISLQVGGDDLYYLVGSGIKLQNETFVYKTVEGIRTSDFTWGDSEVKLGLKDIGKIALSNWDGDLENFLEEYGKAFVPASKPPIQRNQEAVTNKPVNPIDNYLTS
jgi:hypothetical protein